MDEPCSDAATPSESSRFLVAGIDILANPHLPVVPESPLKDRREAVLFMHYVHTLSLWVCYQPRPCQPPPNSVGYKRMRALLTAT